MKQFYLTIIFVLSSLLLGGLWTESSAQVFISQYIETNSGTTPKGIEIFNASGAPITFSAGNALQVYQGTNGSSCSALVTINSGTLQADEVWVIGTSDLTTYAFNNGVDLSDYTTYNFSFNGDDALRLYLGGTLMDVIGTCGNDPGSQWSGGGVSTANQNIQTINGVCSGTTSNWTNPSLRFETVSTNPNSDMTGFGDSPSSCTGPSLPTCTAPSQANSLSFGTVTTSSIAGSFSGSADGYLVVRSTSSSLSSNPSDGTSYSVGNSLGGGTVVAYGSSTGFTASGLNANTQYYFFVFAFTDNGTCTGGPVYATPALSGNETTNALPTEVNFSVTSGSADEDDGNYIITASITNPGTTATTVDLVLVSGDATRIDNYTTQTFTFPASSSSNQDITIDLTNNTACDGTETLTFELQNVSGGNSAFIGSLDEHTLTLNDDDGSSGTIVYQGFESGDTWNYTLSTPDCNNGGDVWSVESSLGGISPAVGSNFWGIQDLDGNCGSSAGESIYLAVQSITGYSNVVLSFQYRADGYDSGDRLEYEVTIDGVGQGIVTLVNAGTTSGWETEIINIPNGSSSVALELFADQNGASDYGGYDDINLTGESCSTVCTPPADPVGTISGTTPACGSSTLSFSGSATSPAVYYWQTTTNGVSTANNAASSLSVSTSGDYYVRAYFPATTCWSDGEVGPYTVTINTAPSISAQPTNTTVYTGDNTQFSVIANNASGYQWEVNTGSGWSAVSNGGVYSGATSATLNITGAILAMDTYQYRCVVSGNSPCADVTSNSAELTVINAISVPDDGCSTNNYATLTFNYPTNLTISDVNVGIKASTTWRGDLSIKLQSPSGTEIVIINSVGGGADNLDALIDDSGTANGLSSGNHTVDGTYDITTQTEGTGTSPLSTFNNEESAGVWTLSICDDASADLAYLHDFEVIISGVPVCVSSATIASFGPTSGPVGTMVTINGTGFTGATDVTFNHISATSFTVISSTTIIAEVPSGLVQGTIRVFDVSNCPAKSVNDFSLLDETGVCGNGTTAGELFISEVYDADVGDYHFVEIFNGTGTAVNLSPYTVRISTGATTDIPLSNVSLAAGDVWVVGIGNSTNPCAVSPDQTNVSGGFNGNDAVFLRKSGVTIDNVPNPGSGSGFSQVRKSTVTSPNTTYTSSEWDITLIESCSNIGTSPYAAGPSIDIISGPADVVGCSSSNMSVSATGSASLNYQWYYNDGSSTTWSMLTTLSGVTVTGATSNSLSISGNLLAYDNYQFYCEVSSGTCEKYSNAAQFTIEALPVYRSVASGNWTTVNTWEVANTISGPWSTACDYPTAANSDEILIQGGYNVVLDTDVSIDKLTIENGSTLELSTTSELTILNSNPGADLLVEGTLFDRGSSANGLEFEDNSGTANDASWTLGSNGTIIKSNTSSVNNYRDFYEGGISNIPSTANWYFRYNGDGNPNTSTVDMFYPNLYFENTANAGNFAWNTFALILSGQSGYCTVKGDLNLGVTGTGTVSVLNNNFNAQPMIIQGDLYIEAGSELSIEADANLSPANYNVSYGTGTGFEIQGSILADGTLDVNQNSYGKLRFTGSNTQYVLGSGNWDLWDVTFNSSATTELGRAIIINNDIELVTGTLDAAGEDITVRGIWNNTGAIYTHNNNKVIFDGTANSTVRSNGQHFFNVEVNTSGAGRIYPVNDDMTVDNLLKVLGGAVDVPDNRKIITTQFDQDAGGTTTIFKQGSLEIN